ncbi:MarR family transcriptional regulator [Ancylobacter dichloromethanicus]|uniref:Transcriptional regulator n=1 Tax=Ancylobacter dichloromethanicus TaxID=518825 RepID=A0A9W6JDR0_9HYPH|nr:MarR family transcriptional regulator [Ancylobacter dichloromethanicus]MBS7552131.1 MarR family transcriptional regulator [Ancylobacter dichloromethanicus]GLK73864.1 transcriptional regulator [Ancylobacter dichloromethanicus]
MTTDGPGELAGAETRTDNTYRLDEQVGFLIRSANQRHTALFGARMIEGLTPPQFAALAKLSEVGPCSQNRLGRLVCLDAATIKGVVDRLAARGLVLATDDPLDRRRLAVDLSERGRAVAATAIVVARDISEAMLEPLTPAEREQAIRLLRKLC